jgi:prepilin-type N-terminal cleavage/methylation domain-containing protein
MGGASTVERAGDRGVSLIEVLVALVLIVPGVIGAAGLITMAARSARDARLESIGVMLAAQKLEQLRALEWNADDAGNGPIVSDVTTDLTRDPPAPGGIGLSQSPAGALDSNVPGFVDYLDVSGRWVGTGGAPPPTAAFIRRWAVTPLPADPANSLVLQVLVTNVARAAQVVPHPAPRRRLPREALLVTVRTRTSR